MAAIFNDAVTIRGYTLQTEDPGQYPLRRLSCGLPVNRKNIIRTPMKERTSMNYRLPAALSAAALVCLLCGPTAHAQTTLDFENLSNPNSSGGINDQGFVVTQNGFTVTDTSKNYSFASVAPNPSIFDYTGSVALFNNSFDGLTVLTQNNGLAFSLDSIDIANLALQSSFPNTSTVVFTGNVQGGGTVTKTFTTLPNDSLQTVTFSNFTDLSSVSFDQEFPSNQFDNIVVDGSSPVPEASTTVSLGLLLALGMGGVVIAARRRKAAKASA